jgi:hypothetical protein
MAPSATNHHSPGRVGRVVHWLLPSRRRLIAEVAIEVAALISGLPLAIHVLVAVVAHEVIRHCRRSR